MCCCYGQQITLFSKHEDGVVVVKFESTGSAATCIDVMNGRFFAGRKLECSFWDGADYTYRESKDEEKERADKFSSWLEEGSSSSEAEEEDDDGDEDEDDEKEGKREAESKQSEHEHGDDAAAESIHAGRTIPDSKDDEDDDEEEDDDEAPAADAIHAGRVMPDLDDSDGDEDE